VRVLIAVALLAVACSKKSQDESPPEPLAPVVDVCDLGIRALDRVTCTSAGGAIQKARKTFVGFVDAVRKATQADAHQFQIMCAQMLTALEKDATAQGCKLDLQPADRTALKSVLDAYYAERAKVEPTGDAASDAVIKRAVDVREAMCSCSTMMCLELVDKRLDEIGALPDKAPQVARDMGGRVIDDIGRCETRIRAAAGL
jgi:hypothetical protein